MSQKRARLRALASLGLSLIVLGALAPVTSATSPAGADAQVAFAELPAPSTVPTSTVWLATRPADVIGEAFGTTTLDPTSDTAIALRRALLPDPDPSTTVSAASLIIHLAETHIGASYAHGATGPHAFDCSGLVYRVFEDAGLGRTIDWLESASALYAHFKALHKTSTRAPQPGDLVIFGGGSHVGIYIGGGRVIHAMVTGVAITSVSAVYPRFTTYVHLGLGSVRLSR